MTEKYKSIVAPVWAEFVAELKRTTKEGKQNPQRLLYQHSFFKAVMVEGENEGFVKCLDSITGNEVNCLELIDKLQEAASIKRTETLSFTVPTVQETRESGVDIALVKSEVIPRKTRAKRGKTKGE